MSELHPQAGSGSGAMTIIVQNSDITGDRAFCDNVVHVNNYLGRTSSEVEDIASWLCIEQHRARHDEHHMRRAEGTLKGFFESDMYIAWVKDKGTQSLHLECRGMPGAGKSILASAVVDDLQIRLSSTSDLVVYAYFRYDSQANQTPEFVISHLLGQVVRRCGEVSAKLLALYKEYSNKNVPRLDKATDALRLAISGRKMYVVLDALDEYSIEDYDRVLPLINALLGSKAKLLVTSRHSVPLPANNFSSFEVRADSNDVRILIVEHVKNYHRLATFIKDSPELLEEIVTKISEHTNGMFIIVRLVLELLSGQMTPHGVRKQLNHLPAGLDNTYELAMERVHSQSSELVHIADEAFAWVFYAVVPLSTQQLQHGVSFDTVERHISSEYLIPVKDILAACCGLITVVDNKCQFVHFSTKEFFEKHLGKYFPGAERQIAKKCLCYAAVAAAQLAELDTEGAIESKISDMKLCIYASSYWGPHASRVLEDFDELEDLVEDLIKQVLWPKMVDEWETHIVCVSGHYGIPDFPSQHCLILYLARYGLDKLLPVYWNRNASAAAVAISDSWLPDNPNLARDRNGWAAIHFAAWSGHEKVAQFLIEQGAEVNLSAMYGGAPLRVPVSNGQDSIAPTLCDNDVDPNTQYNSADTPLYFAMINGHLSLATILLDNGAYPGIELKYSRTVLHIAASIGHESIALTLLRKGSDPNAQDKAGYTPLHNAIFGGHLSVVTILLDNGAGVDVADIYGRTPLHIVASRGCESIALTLLGHGADPNAQDVDGDAPLHKAIDNGQFSLTLPDDDAHPDIVNKYSRTALLAAADDYGSFMALFDDGYNSFGTPGVGADLNAQDTDGDTPLHNTMYSDRLLIIAVLFDNGARPDVANRHGWTPLHVAARQGYDSIALTLLGNRADPNAQDKYGDTPLHLAIYDGHLSLTTILLNRGARPDVVNIYGRTPLHIAVSKGRESIALTLLGKGADPNAQDKDGDTPLHDAVINGHLSLMEMLLDKGADVNRQNRQGATALHYAAERGRASLFPILLSAGADLDIQTHTHRTPLAYAIRFGHTKVVSLLIERGLNVFVVDAYGKTALDHALYTQYSDIVNLFVLALVKKYRPRVPATSLTPNQEDQAPDYQSPAIGAQLPEANDEISLSSDMEKDSPVPVAASTSSHDVQTSDLLSTSLPEIDEPIPLIDEGRIVRAPLTSDPRSLADSPYNRNQRVYVSLLILAVAISWVRWRR